MIVMNIVMREFKFRAWDEKKKEMFQPRHIEQVPATGIWIYGKNKMSDDGIGCKIEKTKCHRPDINCKNYNSPFKLMQYTGLKDKNGNEIYEGDIVRNDEFKVINPIKKEDMIRYIKEVRFDVAHGEWYLINENDPNFDNLVENGGIFGIDSWEVIGNIYENPELLKKERD